MAGTKTAVTKAAATKVKTTPKKAATKRGLSRGQKVACDVCGLIVTVNEIGDDVYEEDDVLLCCGKPMKAKAAAKKVTATKKATKK